LLYSWDADYEYRYTDVFPSFSVDGNCCLREKNDNSSIAIMDADGSNKTDFQCRSGGSFFSQLVADGQWVVFGYGGYFQNRKTERQKIMLVKRMVPAYKTLLMACPMRDFRVGRPDGKR